MQRTHLLIIDPQNDFCSPDMGSLYVPGADQDMNRLTTMIDRIRSHISDIHVTLDSHHLIDIAHPTFWQNSQGTPPPAFTQITADDVRNGKWMTRLPSARTRTLSYLDTLEVQKRYPHTIWPPHCLIGSEGHNVYAPLFKALSRWESERFGLVDYVTKGSNLWTEHFSAVQAEVPDPMDPSTQMNANLIDTLEQADLILLAGEAGSHCLANTVRDIVRHFSTPDCIRKMILLEDATSPVPGFESHQHDFIHDMKQLGMQFTTTQDFCLA